MSLSEDDFDLFLKSPADTLDALDRIDCEESLLEFVRRMWSILEPGRELSVSWPLEAICEHLGAVTRGELKRILINVPPGFMKPVWVDEPVMTTRGRIRLGDVVVGDEVLTHRGRFRRVSAVHRQGYLPTVQVTTFAGRVVRAAPDHPFLTTRGWVQAQDLSPDDILGAVTPSEGLGSSSITPEEARLMGYLVGDGSVTHSPIFTNQDEEILADFERCAQSVGWQTSRRSKSASQGNLKATHIGIRGALPWLEKHGLKGGSSYTKRIPIAVLMSGNQIIANFLGAYWSCDGTFAVRHKSKHKDIHLASATTVNRDLAVDVQHALLRLGISSRLRSHSVKLESKKQPGGRYTSYQVITSSHAETAKFTRLQGLVGRKMAKVRDVPLQRFEQGPLSEDEVISVEAAGEHECMCLTVEEDSSFTAGDLAVHNSLLCNVFWPAWEWGPQNMPSLRYVNFSYSSLLTERDNRRFRDVMLNHDYGRLFGDRFALMKTGEQLVSNDKTGWKLATSVGGVGTGERGDRVVLDDPHNVRDGESDLVRKSTVTWFREAMSNRLNDENSAIIVIMQRVHEEDVSGVIISELRHEYEHLMIPYEWEGRRLISTVPTMDWNEDPRTEVGEEAWPERLPTPWKQFKITLGPYAVASQYQQSPTPRGGGIFKREWWQTWDPEPDSEGHLRFPQCEFIVASFDGAFGQKQENDFSALTVWGVFRKAPGVLGSSDRMPRHYLEQIKNSGQMVSINSTEMRSLRTAPRIILMHAWRKRLPLNGPDVDRMEGETDAQFRRRTQANWGIVQWVADTCRRFRVHKLLIEAKANGIDVAQEVRRQYQAESWGTELVDPGRLDKAGRAYSVQHLWADEMVYAPDREWADEVIDEMAVFPKGGLDDYTDTATQALKYLRDIGIAQHQFEVDRDFAESLTYTPEPKPLYPA